MCKASVHVCEVFIGEWDAICINGRVSYLLMGECHASCWVGWHLRPWAKCRPVGCAGVCESSTVPIAIGKLGGTICSSLGGMLSSRRTGCHLCQCTAGQCARQVYRVCRAPLPYAQQRPAQQRGRIHRKERGVRACWLARRDLVRFLRLPLAQRAYLCD